ncbi:class I SAM-dependent methyltransferase [Sneathiella marina]|uniref:Class I SAM-dependent methyltransferase n=1 Tax=Sneathiella marina TaxID=2950108 RepID=A0ABY4WA74_9PROT|nr:class I SAM-dependent methyltransferase [Sneathiella marina]USG62807.1 class I SAM-dependent methyltransferase [Sneathiella marina]
MSSKVIWENVKQCNYCGKSDFFLFMRSTEPHWTGDEPLTMMECKNCGLVFASPRPNATQFNKNYLVGDEKARAVLERKRNRPNVRALHLNHVKKALEFHDNKATSLFDMGCGAGTIMEAAKELGLDAEGNDINLAAINELRELGFNAYHGFTNQLELPKNNFDIVINFDYLEHSYNPYEDLKTCNEILKMGGLLSLKTLYLDCPDHILKSDRYQLFRACHYHYFSARNLASMVYKAGFEILELNCNNLIFIIARKMVEASNDRPIDYYDYKIIDTNLKKEKKVTHRKRSVSIVSRGLSTPFKASDIGLH